MAATKNDDAISTSCDVINPFCGCQRKQFSTYYLSTKSHCHSSNFLEVLRGDKGGGCREVSEGKLTRYCGTTLGS